MDIIILLGIAFGILQIILFFKLWAMTNNVKKIKDRIFKPSIPVSIIRREIKKKNPHIGDLLFDAMWDELQLMWENRDEYVTDYPKRIEFYKKLYEQAGVPFPEDAESIKSNADYEKFSLKRN